MKRLVGLLIALIMVLTSVSALAYDELAKGNKGDNVVELQNRLNELGYSVGKADGDFGGKTETAVKAFQTDNDIEATGIADANTLEKLFYEEHLYLIQDKGRNYGYCNEAGEIVIPCQWRDACSFSNGMARVKKTALGYWGYINETGELVIPCDWEIAYDFEYGYATAVYRRGSKAKSAVFNKKGEEVIPLDYYYNDSVTEGIYIYYEKGDVDQLNAIELSTGRTLFQMKDVSFAGSNCYFSEGILGLADYKNHKYIFVDRLGKTLGSSEMDYTVVGYFHDGLLQVYDGDSKRSGYKNAEGDLIIPCRWKDAEDFSEGLACVADGTSDETLYGYIDTTGSLITEIEYRNAKSFQEGMAAVQGTNNMWGFINKQGKVVIDFLYDDVESFENGYSLVTSGYDRYYINPNGEIAFAYYVGDDINSFVVPEKKADVAITPKPTATPTPPDKYSKEECKNKARTYMAAHLRPYLRNPASLQIIDISGSKTGTEYLFTITYTAMNGFGGYTPGAYYCKVDCMSGEVTMGGIM